MLVQWLEPINQCCEGAGGCGISPGSEIRAVLITRGRCHVSHRWHRRLGAVASGLACGALAFRVSVGNPPDWA